MISCIAVNVVRTNRPTNISAATWQNQHNDCAPSEHSDQPGHPPSLIRVFAVCIKKAWVLSYPFSAQWALRSDWADAQADVSLRWAHTHFVGFVMSWFIFILYTPQGSQVSNKFVLELLGLGIVTVSGILHCCKRCNTPTNHSHAKPLSTTNLVNYFLWNVFMKNIKMLFCRL